MAGISWSVSPGITGAISTVTGMPASASLAMALSLYSGCEALGSIFPESSPSSVVTEMTARAQPIAAMSERMSISRVTR